MLPSALGPRPLNPLPLRKRPGTPKVSMFSFFSSAQVVLLGGQVGSDKGEKVKQSDQTTTEAGGHVNYLGLGSDEMLSKKHLALL